MCCLPEFTCKYRTHSTVPTIMLSDHWGISSMDYRLTVRTGFTLETGRGQWLWDLSANVAGWQYRPEYNGPLFTKKRCLILFLLETGLRYEFKRRHFVDWVYWVRYLFRYAVPTKLGTRTRVPLWERVTAN